MKKITGSNIYTGIKIILRYLKTYKKEVMGLSVLGIISAIGNGTVPYIAGKFFDSIISPGTIFVPILSLTLPLLWFLLSLWIFAQLVSSLVDWRINIRSEVLSNTIWTDYIANGFSYLWELPMSFHKQHKIGEVSNKINRAGNSLETIVGRIVIDLSPQFLSIVIAAAIALYIQPILCAVLLFGVGVYWVILMKKTAPLAKIQKEYYDALEGVWGDMYDAAGNTITIKQSTTEQYERNKLYTGFKEGVSKYIKMSTIWSNLSFLQRGTILVTQILIFIISIIFIRRGSMTLGDLLAFNAYATMMFGPFVTMGRNWQTIQNGIIDLNEAEKFLSTTPEIYEPAGAISKKIEGKILFENVDFLYDEGRPVLQNISFEVKTGEVVALVGESGVGKSTLIDLISGYHFPTNGKVLIDGDNIKLLNLRNLRSQISVVPQEVVLFNDTIVNNIKYGNFHATQEEVEGAARKAHAIDFIEKFTDKWNQMVGERGVKLSVGQKQRVAIARAILRNPKILILDEPTSALDAGSEQIITKSLEELMEGKTTFIIAHRLSTVRKADKILVFKEGRIIETGNHTELLKIEGGEYRRLYELQVGLHD